MTTISSAPKVIENTMGGSAHWVTSTDKNHINLNIAFNLKTAIGFANQLKSCRKYSLKIT
jgi:hypothetical protein